MSDLIVIQPQVTTLTVTEDVNQVVVSSVGVQGAKGDTGNTGPQGPSGVIAVTAPITNSGTSTSANLSISAGTTSAAGALQLTDSVASTSTTTAATPNAVKTAYDLANFKTVLPSQTGFYVRTPTAVNNGLSVSTNVAYYSPIYVRNTTTFDRIAVCTAGGFSGSASVRLGIYSNGTDGKPNTLILDAGTVTATVLNTIYQITISQTFTEGIYWLVCVQQSLTGTSQYLGSNFGNNSFFSGVTSSSNLGLFVNGYFQNSVTGALSTASVTGAQSVMPYTYLRVA
jgi:hypothetical protein